VKDVQERPFRRFSRLRDAGGAGSSDGGSGMRRRYFIVTHVWLNQWGATISLSTP
jgi:hypothetical protein